MCNETIAVPEPMPEAEILCRECEVMVYLIDAWLDDEDNIEELDGYIEGEILIIFLFAKIAKNCCKRALRISWRTMAKGV